MGLLEWIVGMPDVSCPTCGEKFTVFGPTPWLANVPGIFCGPVCGRAAELKDEIVKLNTELRRKKGD